MTPLESPLFNSSFQLLAQAIKHYHKEDGVNRKFQILHLATAIELLLKDYYIEKLDKSIYEKGGRTISCSRIISELSNDKSFTIKINKLQILLDQRHTLQHSFGYPNELQATYYMRITMEFFSEVIQNYYDESFNEILKGFLDTKDHKIINIHNDNKRIDSLKNMIKSDLKNLTQTFLEIYSVLEDSLNELNESLETKVLINMSENFQRVKILKIKTIPQLKWIAEAYDIPLDVKDANKLDRFHDLYNRVRFGHDTPLSEDIIELNQFILDFLPTLEKIEEAVENDPDKYKIYIRDRAL